MAAELGAGSGHGTLQQREAGARQPRISANKKPRGRKAHGADERVAGTAYFFATKMYFATCDLWFEAELRWMTLLFTARSSAEL